MAIPTRKRKQRGGDESNKHQLIRVEDDDNA